MTYLMWYLALGVVVLLVIFVSHRASLSSKPRLTREILDYILLLREPLNSQVLIDIITPFLAMALVIAVWPAAVYMKIKEMYFDASSLESEEKREFTVTRDDLLLEIPVEEIERRECVADPLGAVPELPFGHLNTAWRKLLESRTSQDTIWTFTAQWTSNWGRKEIRSGYVLVRDEGIGSYFMTARKTLDDNN